MKKLPVILLSLFLLFAMNACLVVSIHPVGTDSQRLFDRDLIGKWAEGEGFYEFQSMGDSLYALTIYGPQSLTEQQFDTLRFEVGLYEVGEFLFLDYYPYDDEKRADFLFYQNYLPVHTFAKIEKKSANQFNLYYFDYERINKLFDQNRIRLRHEKVEDVTILTDGTEEIQRFLKKYAEDSEAFDDVVELKRLADE